MVDSCTIVLVVASPLFLTQKLEAETSKRVDNFYIFTFALWIGTKRVDYKKMQKERFYHISNWVRYNLLSLFHKHIDVVKHTHYED